MGVEMCHHIHVGLDCLAELNGDLLTENIRMDGVYIRLYPTRVRISVPNCGNVSLIMWVTCQNVSGQEMIRFNISRGIPLQPTSHGLLGKGESHPFICMATIISLVSNG